MAGGFTAASVQWTRCVQYMMSTPNLRFYSPSCTFTNALSPVQVAIVSKALEIVRSAEGAQLRRERCHACGELQLLVFCSCSHV